MEILMMTKRKVRVNIYIKMEINMKEILKMVQLKEEEYIIIIMEKQKEIDMKEILNIGIKKEKEFIIIKMEIDMKEILKII